MLTVRELATLRAALQYWQEELGPAGPAAMGPYLEAGAEPLSNAELHALRALLEPAAVRYAAYNPAAGELASTRLYGSPEEALATLSEAQRLATLLLPAD